MDIHFAAKVVPFNGLIVIVRVPGLWIVMPWLPGRKMVVYQLSDILFTLINDRLSPGIISASLAFGTIWSKGKVALPDDWSLESFGRETSIRDGPVFGKCKSLLMKCDVAPESIIILLLFQSPHPFVCSLWCWWVDYFLVDVIDFFFLFFFIVVV